MDYNGLLRENKNVALRYVLENIIPKQDISQHCLRKSHDLLTL